VEGRNPVRILIDFDLKVPRNFKIYNDEAPTLVFNQEKKAEEGNVKFIKISKENFMEELMQKLYENQIQSVLVEGGSRTLQTFIDQNLWDETIIIKNENLLLENGTKAPKFNGKTTEEKFFRDNVVSIYRNL
jgi:diaminohydroxyphosphoribosylaminopyrimidine deaminase/5-amino-6-(5-phosphoribosylamino)uracil reductase